MDYTAHIENGRIQTVSEHSKNTAEKAGSYAKKFGLVNTAQIQGLLHDFGKMRKDFDDYINKRNNVQRGEIDHAYAGAKYLNDFVCKTGERGMEKSAEFIARTIISHHGLHDWVEENGEKYFSKRLSKTDHYDEICSGAKEIISEKTLLELLNLVFTQL